MDRRHVVEAGLAGVVCLGIPLSSWARSHGASPASSLGRASNPPKSIKIIGVGGAGCNVIQALKATPGQFVASGQVEFIGVDLGVPSRPSAGTTKELAIDGSQIRTISLEPYGAGGRVHLARDAAMSNIDVFIAAVNGAETVILVAGLGGGTGSGVTPIIARLARNAGAVTAAAVVMPFDFEGTRTETARTALRHLKRKADAVMSFSNQELGDVMGDGSQLTAIFDRQDKRIMAWLQRISLG